MPLETLVSTLVSEHGKMKAGLDQAMQHLQGNDYEGARRALAEVDRVFRQHIADEEGQILRLLIETYGREGAEDAIIVFRQHRPIYTLIDALARFSYMSVDELAQKQGDLRKLLDEHTGAEESRVFPRALSARSHRAPSETGG